MFNSKSVSIIQGFTLIEVLVASVVTVILGGAILSLIFITTQTRLSSYRNVLNVDLANQDIDQMARELRNIRPGDNAAYPIVRAKDQEIIFYSDVDYDGSAEKVRYTLTSTQLVRGITKATGYPAQYLQTNEKVKILSDFIRNGSTPVFYYYNGDWPNDTTNNPLIDPVRLSDSKLIKVYIIINSEDDTDNFSLETYIQLRTLKQNL
jgi:prepilin-type N-terminal cleavage/methylation domain-containing protein